MKLNEVRHGDVTSRPSLVILHGLFGSARNWTAICKRLAGARQVVALDLRNHGDSGNAAPHRYADLAADVVESLAGLPGPVDLLGHSMGGKVAMQIALTDAAALRRLIVADIAPVPYDHSHAGHIAAMRALPLDGITRRSEADARLAPAVPDRAVRAFLLQSLEIGAQGARWKLGLDALAADMGAITGWPGTPGRFDGPALFLAGGASEYVTPGMEPAIRAQFPAAQIARLAGAGHWLHAEQPGAFVDAVGAFLES